MDIFSVLLAACIGILLGLIGAGGSTITIPVFVYILKYDVKSAIAMSLFVVGATSIVGAIRYYRSQSVDLSHAFTFGLFTVPGTFFGAEIARLISNSTQLLLFSVVLLFSSLSMYKEIRITSLKILSEKKYQIIFESFFGIIIGIITGVVGIGGGFLLVPSLVLLCHLDMKKAVGTSLLIIFFNTIAGFLVYSHITTIDWKVVGLFSVFSIAGMILSTFLIRFISDKALKKAFSIIVFLIGIFILFHHHDRLSLQNHEHAAQIPLK